MATEPKTDDEMFRERLEASLSSEQKMIRRVISREIEHILLLDPRVVHLVPE
jgi:hypothetical protein